MSLEYLNISIYGRLLSYLRFVEQTLLFCRDTRCRFLHGCRKPAEAFFSTGRVAGATFERAEKVGPGGLDGGFVPFLWGFHT